VRQVCELAANDYGLTSLVAATAPDYLASQAVLTRAGFVGSVTVQVDAQPALRFIRISRLTERAGQPIDEFRVLRRSQPPGLPKRLTRSYPKVTHGQAHLLDDHLA
jgi:hypothetical protein